MRWRYAKGRNGIGEREIAAKNGIPQRFGVARERRAKARDENSIQMIHSGRMPKLS
jgi:hypothetical protein